MILLNIFNNQFASIAETSSTIFLTPIYKEEIGNIISSLNSDKASGPNSIPYRNIVSSEKWNFEAIIQPLFYDWLFSFCTQNCKSSYCFQERLKLDYTNYRPISLLSNIEKILDKIIYKRLYNFLKYFIYSLDASSSILYLVP